MNETQAAAPGPMAVPRNGKATRTTHGSVRATPASSRQSYWPTSKWWAASVTAFVAATAFWIRSGSTREVALAWLAVGGQAVVSYLVPNHPAPGGVPGRHVSDAA